MAILHKNYIYEAIGSVFTDDDMKIILEESGVGSIKELNTLLEAIDDKNKKLDEEPEEVPDLEAPPEELEIEKNENNQPSDEQLPGPIGGQGPNIPPDISNNEPENAPEEPSNVPPIDVGNGPVAPAEEEAPVEPTPETTPVEKPIKEPVKANKPEAKPLGIKEPPAIEPEKKLPEKEMKDGWLVGKTLRTLYNNYISFFKGSKLVDKVGTIIGLNAPGLQQDSKYLMANVTAFVQGSDPKKDPYSVWMVFRRKRQTQNWSMNSPIECRCNCAAFNYYSSYSLWKASALAGRVARNKPFRDENGVVRKIDMTIPATHNNPNSTPILCKHLALVTKRLLDNGMIDEK